MSTAYAEAITAIAKMSPPDDYLAGYTAGLRDDVTEWDALGIYNQTLYAIGWAVGASTWEWKAGWADARNNHPMRDPYTEAPAAMTEKACPNCDCCDWPPHGACSTYERGMNGRCVYCDHARGCHEPATHA